MNKVEDVELEQNVLTSLSKKDRVNKVKSLIKELQESYQGDGFRVPIDAIKSKKDEGCLDISDLELDSCLDILIRNCEIYSPPNGGYRVV